MTVGHVFRHVAELASSKFPATKHPTFNKIFDVKVFNPECRASPELAQKYGVSMENVQQVVAIQNLITSDLTWWNPARKTKPQNFKAASAATSPAAGIHDPTGGGSPATCDFCSWQNLTAEDTFGRIEGPYAVTASNLFKYGAPFQGVVLFKHHDPLSFNFLQLSDLLTVADGWFTKSILQAQKEKEKIHTSTTPDTIEEELLSEPPQLYPLLVWNCLGRAGASQFHGHAQVMVSGAPFPSLQREYNAVMQYKMRDRDSIDGLETRAAKKKQEEKQGSNEGEADYYHDLVEAHGVVGLARRLVIPGNATHSGLSDKNIDIIWDDKVSSSATSVSNTGGGGKENNRRTTPELSTSAKPATATAHVSLCPTKDAEIVIHGSSLTCPAFQMVFYAALRALIDDLGVESFNAGIYNIPIDRESIENNNRVSKVSTPVEIINNSAPSSLPVVARIVSRGRLSSGASDFGGLEVFAGASIGHTDPWTAIQALDESLKRAIEE